VPLDVALATCIALPEPDPDMEPLLGALRSAGVKVKAMGWDDPYADFAQAPLTIVRSTWNYSEQHAKFLRWVDDVALRSDVWNTPATIRWNTHKSYLLDLEAKGVPVVPTHLLERGDKTPLAEVLRARGWSEVVVKPAVSGGSRMTKRVRPGDDQAGEAHLRALATREDVLVQPYQASVEGHGERAIITVDGHPTHAVRKTPRFVGDPEQVSEAMPIEADEEALARQALAAAPGPLLYGRVDMARGEDGKPRVMELELVEPSLFFRQSPDALARYVEVVKRLLGRWT
jgi:glutathione synthase/RimK-type ligase-like ATP-grasp enzyme